MKKQYLAVISAIVCVGLCIGVYFLGSGSSSDTSDTESYRTIKVLEFEGLATIDREDIGEISVYDGMQLVSGDKITVDEESYVRLVLDDDKYIYIEENTILSIIASGDENDSQTEIVIETGAIINELTVSLSDDSSYEVTTPNASMSVRGTVYGVEVYEMGGIILTDLSVFEGVVASQLIMTDSSKEQELEVPKGYAVTVESDIQTYCEYVLGELTQEEVYPLEITDISDGMLSLLEKVVATTEKEIQFIEEEILTEIERREEASSEETSSEETSSEEVTSTNETIQTATNQTSTYTLTLVNQNNKTVYTYEENSTITIAVPVLQGYTFVGWYDEDYTEKIEVTNMPSSDLELYALWEIESYSVSIDGDIQLVEYNECAIEPFVSTVSGYSFVGWYLDGSIYDFNTAVTSDLVIESVWKASTNTLTTDVDSVETNYSYTTYQQLNLEDPEKEGYKFTGWVDGEGNTWTNSNVMPTEDLVLYATFTEDTFVVTLYNGDTIIDTVDVLYSGYIVEAIQDSSISIDTADDSYLFVGWYEDKELAVSVSSDATMGANDISLYGKWEQYYTLTYTMNGVSYTKELLAGENAMLDYSEDCLVGEQLSRQVGWYAVGDDTTLLTSVIMPEKDYAVIAAFESLYTITFINGTTELSYDYTCLAGETLDLMPVLTSEDSTESFVGWYDINATTGGTRWMVGSIMPAENLTVYARWGTDVYPVYLMSENTVVEVIYMTVGTYVSTELANYNITKTGYTFDGWYFSDGTKLGDDYQKQDINLYIYVKWVENEYCITYVDDDGNLISTDSKTYGYTDSVKLESSIINNGYITWNWKNSATGSSYSLGATVSISELATGALYSDGIWVITLKPTWYYKI